MTLKPLHDDPIAIASPLSVRHWRDVGLDGQLLELREELARRVQSYPAMVTRGTLKPEAAEQQLAVWRAIVADQEGAGVNPPTAPGPIGWDAKVRELRRELAVRRVGYPKWIASPTNALTRDAAARKLERLDAVHARYWLCVEHFGADRSGRHDPRRMAYLARRIALWLDPLWQAMTCREVDGDGVTAPSMIAEAHRQRDLWRTLVTFARWIAGDDIGVADPDRPLIATLRAGVSRLEDACWHFYLGREHAARHIAEHAAELGAWLDTNPVPARLRKAA